MSYQRNNQLNIFLLIISLSIISIFPTILLADDIVDISSKNNNISPNNAMSCIIIIGTIILIAYLFSFQEGPSDTSIFIPNITIKEPSEINLPKLTEPAKISENQYLDFLAAIAQEKYDFITESPNNK